MGQEMRCTETQEGETRKAHLSHGPQHQHGQLNVAVQEPKIGGPGQPGERSVAVPQPGGLMQHH